MSKVIHVDFKTKRRIPARTGFVRIPLEDCIPVFPEPMDTALRDWLRAEEKKVEDQKQENLARMAEVNKLLDRLIGKEPSE